MQRTRRRRSTLVFMLATALMLPAANAAAQRPIDAARITRSILLPGMGQLADGQNAKGLLFLGGECALLAVAIGQCSKASSYSRKTEYLEIEYELADSYDEKAAIKDDWEQHQASAESARTAGIVLSSLAAACWAVNILDAVFFAPDTEASQRRVHPRLTVGPAGATLCCSFDLVSTRTRTAAASQPPTHRRARDDKGAKP